MDGHPVFLTTKRRSIVTTDDKPRCPACGSAKHGYDDCGDRWGTPPEVLELVRAIGPIVLDPCSDPDDVVGAACRIVAPVHVKGRHTSELDFLSAPGIEIADGLAINWNGLGDDGLVYVNPPYSDPAPWVYKALTEADRAVLLLPLNPDVAWYHDLCDSPRAQVVQLRG